MKENELRIGNYVNHNHSIGMKLTAQITEGKDIDMFEEFEPIPLTEEWLLKLPNRLIYPEWIKYLHELQNWYYWNNEKKELHINL